MFGDPQFAEHFQIQPKESLAILSFFNGLLAVGIAGAHILGLFVFREAARERIATDGARGGEAIGRSIGEAEIIAGAA
jgi:hypothetical protein